MNKITTLLALAAIALGAALTGCKDGKTYAQLLTDENHYVNNFLADQRVVGEIPADSVFEYGPDAPYYRIDPDGFLYMQVLNPGTPDDPAYKVKADELIYFRFVRYNLAYYADGKLSEGDGNEVDLTYGSSFFRYQNYQLYSSYQWGVGVQTPLNFLPIDCEVNLVVKSVYGLYEEQSYVQPYLFHLTYYRPKI